MISTKDWGEFKKYVTNCFMDRIRSKEYQKLMELEMKQFENVTEKHKFLWWSWETTRMPMYWEYTTRKYDTEDQRMLVERKYPIPEETLEECLNWLVRRKP